MTVAPPTANAPTAAGTQSTATSDPLGSLSNNFGSFLNLLLTQLKNQDPSSPTDPNAFTTELVQFSGVEQQIKTNASLNSLIELTQAAQTLQSSSLIGHDVTVTSPQLSLQSGKATVGFNSSSGGPIKIDVYDVAGRAIREDTVTAKSGPNTWVWDGTDASGARRPDGAYTVTVRNAAPGASEANLPFTVTGPATGIQRTKGSLQLDLGALKVDFSNIQSVASNTK